MAARIPQPGSIRADRAFRQIATPGMVEGVPELPTLTRAGKTIAWCDEVQRTWRVFWDSPMAEGVHELDLAGVHAAMRSLNDLCSPEATSGDPDRVSTVVHSVRNDADGAAFDAYRLGARACRRRTRPGHTPEQTTTGQR